MQVLNNPNANYTCCLYHMTPGVRPCRVCVSITSILLTSCCQRWAGRAAAIYVACEIGGDNNSCHCQAGARRGQNQLACSFWDCLSLSSMSAATPQLSLSVVCTLWLHPAECGQSASHNLSYVVQLYLKMSTSNQKAKFAGLQILKEVPKAKTGNNPALFSEQADTVFFFYLTFQTIFILPDREAKV